MPVINTLDPTFKLYPLAKKLKINNIIIKYLLIIFKWNDIKNIKKISESHIKFVRSDFNIFVIENDKYFFFIIKKRSLKKNNKNNNKGINAIKIINFLI